MLEPEIDFTDAEETLITDYDEGNHTFELDFNTGEISRKLITGMESVKQFVQLALRTPRFEHAIYSDQFGSEILALIKEDGELTRAYITSELERLVTEALIYDDRIEDVANFDIEFSENEVVLRFDVLALDEYVEVEEVIDVV